MKGKIDSSSFYAGLNRFISKHTNFVFQSALLFTSRLMTYKALYNNLKI